MKALTTVQERLREYSLKLSADGTNMHNGKTIETVPYRGRGGVPCIKVVLKVVSSCSF